jgi:predicted metallopeptidase
MIVKAINEDIQRINMSYIKCLNIKMQRSMMYSLDHALYRFEAEKKMCFEALTLKPKYLRFIQVKEKEYGSAIMWSSEFINKIDNEFIQKYM